MVLGLETSGTGLPLAERQKTANLMAQLSQGSVVEIRLHAEFPRQQNSYRCAI
jgi:hypothetical protein